MAFLEDMRSDEESAPIFKLTDIAQLYKVRLEQLGLAVEKRIHTTRLKKRLLSALPDLRAHSQGRDILHSFEKDIGPALMAASYHDTDAMHLMRAAQVVRKEILDCSLSFNGSFQENCQQEAVPPSLLALVNMILEGANIKHQIQLVHTTTTKPGLAISQLMVFNRVKRMHGKLTHQAQPVIAEMDAVQETLQCHETNLWKLWSLGYGQRCPQLLL